MKRRKILALRAVTKNLRVGAITAAAMVMSLIAGIIRADVTNAVSVTDEIQTCPSVRVIFARGSGGERWTDKNYLAFKDGLEPRLTQMGITHEFYDLDYPAVSIGELDVLAGAFFGAGDAYEYGQSVDAGVNNLVEIINNTCPDTKYILGGYSQGAMVVSKAIRSLPAEKIAYVATFGDPKIFLPEGEAFGSINLLANSRKNLLRTGVIPAACKGKNLSEYRKYVPDCYAYEGMLGSYQPYLPAGYTGKVGTWCNKYDMFCSSYLSSKSHTSYVADGLYENAAQVIAAAVAKQFEIKDRQYSPHDTVILIDSTGSMAGLIQKYATRAAELARQTLDAGGRVALYTYRDLAYIDYLGAVRLCDFDECTLEEFETKVKGIGTNMGGDPDESLLSASFQVMSELKWQVGAVKSLVVLTDAGYHDPDLDGYTFIDVVGLSKRIDPVNFYVVTEPEVVDRYIELTRATGGRVVSSLEEFDLMTPYIMERTDALPQVEEMTEAELALAASEIPEITATRVSKITEGSVRVEFETDAESVVVSLNDATMGTTHEKSVEIKNLDFTLNNIVTLTPLSQTRRGDSVKINLNEIAIGKGGDGKTNDSKTNTGEANGGRDFGFLIPKAPNTGIGG